MRKSLGAKTIAYPCPVYIVGTYDAKGKPNVMNAAWGGICCSRPPCVSVSLRKATYSYGSIVARKAFTVSIPSEAHIKEADLFGIASGRDTDKFAASGLTPTKSELVDAPYVEEFPLVLECQLLHTLEIGLHTLFVGEIKDVKVEETVLDAEGAIDVDKLQPASFDPMGRQYFGLGGFLGKAFTIGKEIGSPS